MSALKEAVWVEPRCLRECMRFSRRHRRYFVIFLAIYVPSLLHWRRYRAVRTGFCAAQWIDDLLDGDRPSPREPLEVVEEVLDGSSDSALARLTRAFLAETDDDARRDFTALVRTMQRDRRRVLERAVWSEAELRAHHRTTFALSVNLLLSTTGCSARAEAVPSLVEALGWCSVVRDLDDDLAKGLNNIPAEVSDRGQWLRAERDRAVALLARSEEELARLDDPRARRILGTFQRSVQQYAAQECGGL